MTTDQVRAVVDAAYKEVHQVTELPAMREAFDRVMAEPAGDVAVEEATVGGVPGRWVSPPDATDAVVLYIHGGAFMLGSSLGYRYLGAEIARAARAKVFLPDYRLAPEHAFPAAPDDCLAAYRGLIADGHDPSSVVIAGDSAGGNLALGLAVALKDTADPLPAAVVLLSPFGDLTLSGRSMTLVAPADPISSREAAEQGIALYLGGADPNDPRASAMFADLSGLPPLLVQIGTSEILLDDSVRIVEAARRAGVDAHLQVSYEMVHVFQMFADRLPQGRTAIDEIGVFVKRVLGT